MTTWFCCRVAELQGFADYQKDLSKRGPVGVLYTNILRQSNAEKASAVVDFAATSRYNTKRLKPGESTRMSSATTSGSGVLNNSARITMRRHLMHHLPSCDGRRGEDLREVCYPVLFNSLLLQ